MPAGRPLKFKSSEELQEKIQSYFDECKQNRRPLTITGLALALDTTRDLLLDYEEKDEYSDTIKKAKLFIHNFAEERLFGDGNKTGIIFNLKNNWNWKDKTETDITSKGEKIEPTTIQIIKPDAVEYSLQTQPETIPSVGISDGQDND